MKKHYPWLWFDADDTLFDYNYAEMTALKETFHSLTLPFESNYLGVYQRINHDLWQALEKQEITPARLRLRRFELLLESLHLTASPEQMSSIYIEQLSICSQLIDGAYEVLKTFHGKSRIAIVTNGLQAVQRSRLSYSMIKDFIDEIIISEEIGFAKPQVEFFEVAAKKSGNPPKSDILIIGDSLSSDMQGGVNYGIDTCWYNPVGKSKNEQQISLTYEIKKINELFDLIV